MIPYFRLPVVQVGPISIHPFGIFASLAVISGLWYCYYTAQREFHGGNILLGMAPWFLFPGFFGAHMAALLFYYPQAIHDGTPWTFFNITGGLSSFGGLFLGTLGAYLFIRHHRLSVLLWFDVLARGFALAFVFGRAGCSIAHDHPGIPTDFFLAMNYPIRNGFPLETRHDLGFYEFLLFVVIFISFHYLGRRSRPQGFFLGWLIVIYSPIRFLLDFLRINDLTYWGLTFGQWSCLALLPIGVWLLWRTEIIGIIPIKS